MKTIKVLATAFILVSLTSFSLAQTTPSLPADLTNRPQMSVEYSLKTQTAPALECDDPLKCSDHRAASGNCPATLEMAVYITVEPTSNYVRYPEVSEMGITVTDPVKGTLIGSNGNGASSPSPSKGLIPGKNLLGVINVPVCGNRSPNLGGWALTFGQSFAIDVRTNYGTNYFNQDIILFGMHNTDVVSIPAANLVLNQGAIMRNSNGSWDRVIR